MTTPFLHCTNVVAVYALVHCNPTAEGPWHAGLNYIVHTCFIIRFTADLVEMCGSVWFWACLRVIVVQ